MNHKRKRPRTKSISPSPYPTVPSRHNIVFHTRPRRRKDAATETAVMHGEDPDAMAWSLGNHKPHVYYW